MEWTVAQDIISRQSCFYTLNRIMNIGKEVIMTIKLSVDSVNFYRPVYRLTTKCYDSYMAYIFPVIGLVNICILYTYSFFGWFPRLWILCRRFGIRCSIFIGRVDKMTTYEDWRDRVFRNIGIQNSDAGVSPKKEHKIRNTSKVWNQEYLYSLKKSWFL
jgi:hypothetical protein